MARRVSEQSLGTTTAKRFTDVATLWETLLNEANDCAFWFTSGTVQMPFIYVDGQLQKYPFDAASCQSLIATASKAPFGHDDQTIFDDTVRKAWQIDACRLSYEDPIFAEEMIRELTTKVRDGMSLPNIRLELYKMLIYEEGGHFAPHRDTLRGDHHIGSVIVSLPMATSDKCTGGNLVVHSPDGLVLTWDGQTRGAVSTFAAFFTDCEHELQVIQSGYRVALAYEVHYRGDTSADVAAAAAGVAVPSAHLKLPAQWTDSVSALATMILNQRNNLVVLTQHLYGTIFDPAKQLKGVDLIVYNVLDRILDKALYALNVEKLEVINEYEEEDYDEATACYSQSVGDQQDVTFYVNDPFVIDSVDGTMHCLPEQQVEDDGEYVAMQGSLLPQIARDLIQALPDNLRDAFYDDAFIPYDMKRKTFFLWKKSGIKYLQDAQQIRYTGNESAGETRKYRVHCFRVKRLGSK